MDLSGLLSVFDELPAFTAVTRGLDGETAVSPLLLPPGARAPVLARLFRTRQVPIVLLTGKVDAASRWMQALEAWLPDDKNVYRFYEPTPLPYERGPWGETARLGRLRVLARLMAGQHPQIPAAAPPLIVSSARAFLQKTLAKRRFLAATRVLRVGRRLDLEKTLIGWAEIGYEAVSVVEAPGQFSRRGGIVDIFPPSSAYPVRIELFGDEIDTMRYFDLATQRSLEMDKATQDLGIVIPPAREALPEAAQRYGLVLPDDERPAPGSLPSWRDDIADLQNGRVFAHLEFYLPLIYAQPATLLDYLPENALVVVDDWRELVTAVNDLDQHANQIAAEQPLLPPTIHPPFSIGPSPKPT
jgi:transcription-repair coupling factor (superfamily II helicase)